MNFIFLGTGLFDLLLPIREEYFWLIKRGVLFRARFYAGPYALFIKIVISALILLVNCS
ncbi:hypothetical protein [Vulcanisaeta sp.]|uniref:hypothetical protein n=1 Tax=Vulcanisaeta sp. TaxID=2020871 RepID=UPI003D0F1E89